MKILAMDTAQGACSAALWADGRVLARRFELMRTGHAERLMPQALEVMEEAGVVMDALDRLACTVGPGTFTGTRVALSAARGMALPLGIPVIGVTTLEAVAEAIPPEEGQVRVAAFDARRGEVFLQLFKGAALEPLTNPQVLKVSDAARAVTAVAGKDGIAIAGTGAALVADALTGAPVTLPKVEGHPDAAFIAAIAARREPGATPPDAFYLREPDAKLPDPK